MEKEQKSGLLHKITKYMKGLRTLIGVLGLALLLCLSVFSRVNAAGDSKAITIMIYMCGSNLESENGAATSDITEMLRSEFDQNQVNVLAMTGGSTKWWSGFSSTETEIYEISGRRPQMVYSDGLLNMGDPETLECFLNFAYEKYPAEKYALVLWDHGGGPMSGVCWDSLANSDNLTMLELQEALENSPFKEKPLEWIGFDACLMSSVETAYLVSPYAGFMIASQETEPGTGWSYAFLNGIEQDSDGSVTGKRIVDTYFDFTQDRSDAITLSCVDLSKADMVEAALNNFFGNLAEVLDTDTYSALSNMRQGSKGFGRAEENNNDYDLVDLTDLTQHYAEQVPDHSGELEDALAQMIVYSRSNMDNSNGLSIYHPYYNKALYENKWEQEYSGFFFAPGYTDYLKRFAEIWLGEQIGDWSRMMLPDGQIDADLQNQFHVTLTPEQQQTFASAQLMVFMESPFQGKSSYSNVFVTDDVRLNEDGSLTADYSGETLYVVDENNDPITGVIEYQLLDGNYLVSANFISDVETTAHTFFLCSAIDGENDLHIQAHYVYDENSGQYTNRLSINPDNYEEIYFPHSYRIPTYQDEVLLAYADWEKTSAYTANVVYLPKKWHFRFFDRQLGHENLHAGFQITDTQANVHTTELIQIENPNVIELMQKPQVIESDSFKAEIMARLNQTKLYPSLELDFTFTNLSNVKSYYEIADRNCVINKLSVKPKDGLYVDAMPGETKKDKVVFDGPALMNIKEISQILFNLEIIDAEDYSAAPVIYPVVIDLNGADVSSFTDSVEQQALSECTMQDVKYELVSLTEEEDGNISGVLYCQNRTKEKVSHEFSYLVMNGLMINIDTSRIYIDLEADTGTYVYFKGNVQQYYVNSLDLFHTYKKMAIDNVFIESDITEISTLMLVEERYKENAYKVLFSLREPIVLECYNTETKEADDKDIDVFDEPYILFEQNEVLLRGVRALVIDDKVILELLVENNSDRDREITFYSPMLNGNTGEIGTSMFDVFGNVTFPSFSGVMQRIFVCLRSPDIEGILHTGEFLMKGFQDSVSGIWRVTMSFDTEPELGQKEGEIVPFSAITVKVDDIIAGQPDNPVVNPEILIPENPLSWKKSFSFQVEEDLDQVDSVSVCVAKIFADKSEFENEDGEETEDIVAQALAWIPLEEQEEGIYTGEWSGLLLTLGGSQGDLVMTRETRETDGETLYTMQQDGLRIYPKEEMVSDLADYFIFYTLSFDIRADWENKEVNLDNIQITDFDGEKDYSVWGVSSFENVEPYISAAGYMDQGDGTVALNSDYFWTLDAVTGSLNNEPLQLEFVPAVEYGDSIQVLYRIEYKDGTEKRVGFQPY